MSAGTNNTIDLGEGSYMRDVASGPESDLESGYHYEARYANGGSIHSDFEDNDVGSGHLNGNSINNDNPLLDRAVETFFTQSDAYLVAAIEQSTLSSPKKYLLSLGRSFAILGITGGGSFAFWQGSIDAIYALANRFGWQWLEKLALPSAGFSLVESTLPFAVAGERTIDGVGASTEAGKIFLESAVASIKCYIVALVPSFFSAAPLGGLTLHVTLPDGKAEAVSFSTLAFGSHWIGTWAEAVQQSLHVSLSPRIEISASRRMALEYIHREMKLRIIANKSQYVPIWERGKHNNTRVLCKGLLENPPPEYDENASFLGSIAIRVMSSGIVGYLGNTALALLLFLRVFYPDASINNWLVALALDIVTPAFDYLFYCMLVDAATAIFSDIATTIIDVYRDPSKIGEIWQKKLGLAGKYFGRGFKWPAAIFFGGAILTVGTNAENCLELTRPALYSIVNALQPIVSLFQSQDLLDTDSIGDTDSTGNTNEVVEILADYLKWVLATFGATMSGCFNSLGSVDAWGYYLLKYLFIVLSTTNQHSLAREKGVELFIRGVTTLLPGDKAVPVLLAISDEKVKKSIIERAKKQADADSSGIMQRASTFFCCRERPVFEWNDNIQNDILQQRENYVEPAKKQGWIEWAGSFFYSETATSGERQELLPRSRGSAICCSII